MAACLPSLQADEPLSRHVLSCPGVMSVFQMPCQMFLRRRELGRWGVAVQWQVWRSSPLRLGGRREREGEGRHFTRVQVQLILRL